MSNCNNSYWLCWWGEVTKDNYMGTIKKRFQDLEKGFTMAEILVVTAIIAVLITVVLTNVAQYLTKGRDASVKANINTIMTNSAVYFDTLGTYVGFCSSSGYTVAETALLRANGGIAGTDSKCSVTATAFCTCGTLKNVPGNVFCADSRGVKKDIASNCTAECPASGVCQ